MLEVNSDLAAQFISALKAHFSMPNLISMVGWLLAGNCHDSIHKQIHMIIHTVVCMSGSTVVRKAQGLDAEVLSHYYYYYY